MFGGRIKGMIVGSAPTKPEILEFLKAVLSCNVFDGYGSTECTKISEMMLEELPEMGYLSTDKNEDGEKTPRGEVCLRGPGVFQGYFGEPEKTKEVLDA